MDFSKGGDKPKVPVNPMGERYVEIHQKANPESGPRSPGSKAKAQLKLAEEAYADVPLLARHFLESVEALEREYIPREEPFHPHRSGEVTWQAKYIENYVTDEVVRVCPELGCHSGFSVLGGF